MHAWRRFPSVNPALPRELLPARWSGLDSGPAVRGPPSALVRRRPAGVEAAQRDRLSSASGTGWAGGRLGGPVRTSRDFAAKDLQGNVSLRSHCRRSKGLLVAAARLFTPPRVRAESGPTAACCSVRGPAGRLPPTVIQACGPGRDADPDHLLVAERAARAAGGALQLRRGGGRGGRDRPGAAGARARPGRPLLVLSGNPWTTSLVMLGALTAGVPVAPVSVAYSLQSQDHARIRAIAALIRPGCACSPRTRALRAPRSTRLGELRRGSWQPAATGPARRRWRTCRPPRPGAGATRRYAGARPADSVAKILFTSGSTGDAQGGPEHARDDGGQSADDAAGVAVPRRERPVIVDWLPWSHTFGGNHNLNMVLTSGGTLYVDAGRPAPGLFAQTRRQPGRCAADHLLQRARGLRPAGAGAGGRPGVRGPVLLPAAAACSTRRPRCPPGCGTGSVSSPSERHRPARCRSPGRGARPRPRPR